MPTLRSYDYAYIRIMPDQARREFVTVGVILFCRTQGYLDARFVIDETKLRRLDSDLAVDEVRKHLELIPRICAGEGPIGELGQAESFHWLVAPHNTVVHASPVHSGLCENAASTLDGLMRGLTGDKAATGEDETA